MADFTLWGTACETAFWPSGTFVKAYVYNIINAVDDVLAADPVTFALKSFMKDRDTWTGTASNLKDYLERDTDESVCKSKSWPKTPQALSGKLRLSATFLRLAGIDYKKIDKRIISLTNLSESQGDSESTSSIDEDDTLETDPPQVSCLLGEKDSSTLGVLDASEAKKQQQEEYARKYEIMQAERELALKNFKI